MPYRALGNLLKEEISRCVLTTIKQEKRENANTTLKSI